MSSSEDLHPSWWLVTCTAVMSILPDFPRFPSLPSYQGPVVGDSNGAVLTLAGPCGGRPVRILRLVGQAPVVVPVHPLVVLVGHASVTAAASHPIAAVQHVLLAQVGRENTSRL